MSSADILLLHTPNSAFANGMSLSTDVSAGKA